MTAPLARAIALMALMTMGIAHLAAQEALDLDVLIDRLETYLQEYEPKLTELVADEHYVQNEIRRGLSRSRTTEAEVLFLRLPEGGEWFGVRDVKKVDRKEVPGGGYGLSDLLKSPTADTVTRIKAIVDASSKYNLGGRRTINMPTVPLEALSARNYPRFIFKIDGRAKVQGVRTIRISFEEFDEPTLVESVDGGALWTRGTAWIDPGNGAVWRAEVVIGPTAPGKRRRPDLEARVRVEFVHDARLDMLVPKQMDETFWIRGGAGTGTGKYSNFRRFGTSSRLIP